MDFTESATGRALKQIFSPPVAEIFDSDLSRDELLAELRAVHVVLNKANQLLEAKSQLSEDFHQLQVAYHAAIDACAREEVLRKQAEYELAEVRNLNRR